MARTQTTPSAYFRQLFKENPKLLKERDNEAIYQKWLQDHPGQEAVPQNVKQILSNIKSVLRKKRKGRRAKIRTETPVQSNPPAARPVRTATRTLEQLEEMLDDCLMLANESGKEAMDSVIQLLRKARREVAFKLEM